MQYKFEGEEKAKFIMVSPKATLAALMRILDVGIHEIVATIG